MIQVDATFQAAHEALAKRPLYYLEIDDVDVAFTTFLRSALTPVTTGYGLQGYGVVGYGF
jgi:hypothetical protein